MANKPTEPRYRWQHPHEWLIERAGTWNESRLFYEFCVLVQQLSSDQIQDLYQSDMAADGYFNDLNEEEADSENE